MPEVHCSSLTLLVVDSIILRRCAWFLRSWFIDVGRYLIELHSLDELVESGSEQGAKERAEPVDPVVAGKAVF